MGARLEMMMTRLIAGATLGLLAACGPMAENTLGADLLKDRFAKLTGNALAAAPAPPAVNIATAAPGEVLLVTIMSRGAVAPLTKTGQNGDTSTWISPGQVSITVKDGILIATRGLNEDLMGAEVTGVRAALAAGGGTATRTHSYLDSEDQIKLRELTCTITENGVETIAALSGAREAIKYSESCDGRLRFTNFYWLDSRGGALVQSQQVVAPTTGFLQINPL